MAYSPTPLSPARPEWVSRRHGYAEPSSESLTESSSTTPRLAERYLELYRAFSAAYTSCRLVSIHYGRPIFPSRRARSCENPSILQFQHQVPSGCRGHPGSSSESGHRVPGNQLRFAALTPKGRAVGYPSSYTHSVH